jgi:hypothetical protein
MNVFKTTKKDANGCLQGMITASYKNLVKIFGKPNSKGDGYKVSTEWVLEDQFGHVVYLYDWKSTKKYNKSEMTVKELRALPEYEWHVGGSNNYTNELKEYIDYMIILNTMKENNAINAAINAAKQPVQKKLSFVVKPKVKPAVIMAGGHMPTKAVFEKTTLGIELQINDFKNSYKNDFYDHSREVTYGDIVTLVSEISSLLHQINNK